MAPTRATIACHQKRTAPHQLAVLMSICATPLQTPPGYLSVNTQSPSALLGERPRPGASLAPQPSLRAHLGVVGVSRRKPQERREQPGRESPRQGSANSLGAGTWLYTFLERKKTL